ncbi:MAG TPA: glycosyltransferase family 4 protein [Candidatus Sulfotelmatobacter sp.]|jgi:glycosyltransferase involved in cell wall biosynthesis|nr:glycosyltransferase family 4 protein [Candidatus Sulfotelmatobacter sp.]
MKVCMVAYSFYEKDNRVRRYAETLAKRGDRVDVLSLRGEGQPAVETVDGVRVYRIQRRVVSEKGKFSYLAKILLFFFRSLGFLSWKHLQEHYDLVHVHSIPDFEVFAAIVPKLTGAKIILDLHDLVPEFYLSKFNKSARSPMFRILVGVERLSTSFADHVIAANHIWLQRLYERSVRREDCTVILNYPDTDIFRFRGRTRNDGKFIIAYPGSLNYHQGVDIAVRAFGLIAGKVPQAEFHIYGSGEQFDILAALIDKLKLQDRVMLKGTRNLEEIARIMENCDLGVVAKRSDCFGNEAFSTKIFEFMSLDVPVIVPNTTIDSYYFNDSVVRFFQANDDKSLAEAMLEMIQNSPAREEIVRNAHEFIQAYTWEKNRNVYLNLVDALVARAGNPVTAKG